MKHLLFLFLLSCSTSSDVIVPTKLTSSNRNDKPMLTEFVFSDFSTLGNPPAATFQSIEFYWALDSATAFPLCQLRMGYNIMLQSDIKGRLWLVQEENGYGYFHSYLTAYEIVKMSLVYVSGYEHPVLPNLENRKRIPSFEGDPIKQIIIYAKEIQ